MLNIQNWWTIPIRSVTAGHQLAQYFFPTYLIIYFKYWRWLGWKGWQGQQGITRIHLTFFQFYNRVVRIIPSSWVSTAKEVYTYRSAMKNYCASGVRWILLVSPSTSFTGVYCVRGIYLSPLLSSSSHMFGIFPCLTVVYHEKKQQRRAWIPFSDIYQFHTEGQSCILSNLKNSCTP